MHPIVLLPGMNCTADLWSDCALGETLTPTLDQETIDAQIDALLAELPERFVLAGLSLGAIVAMALALRAPERVTGLILASTNAKAPTPVQQDGWRKWLRRLDAGDTARELQRGILPLLLSEDARLGRPDLVERALRMGDDTRAAQLRAQLRMQSTRTDLLPRLSRLSMPTLIISGREDALCPPTFHTEIAHEIACTRLVSVDAGHLVPFERPREFSELVGTWRERQRI